MSLTRSDVTDLLDNLIRLNGLLVEITPCSLRIQQSLRRVLDAHKSGHGSTSPASEAVAAAIDTLDPGTRAEVDRFVQVLGGRIVEILPRSQATPGKVSSTTSAETNPKAQSPPDYFGLEKAVAARREAEKQWLQRQRKIQHGWAILERLMRKNPQAAMALRAPYASDETPLLLRLAEMGAPKRP